MNVSIWDVDIRAVEEIDAEAAAMLHSATTAAAKILAHRKALDQQGLASQPLFVLAGENHWRPAQRLHHILLLEALRQSGERMTVAYEYPYNMADEDELRDYLRDVEGFTGDDITPYLDFYSNNPIGKGMCDMYVNMASTSLQSPYAMQTLSHYMYTQHVSNRGEFIAFNSDAARTPAGSLSLKDDFTKACIKECLGEAKAGVSITSAKGMWIRNLYMANKLYQYADKQEARIAVQLCGQTHVNGDGQHNKSPQSLRGIFNLWAQPVFSVFQNGAAAEMHGIDDADCNNGTNIPRDEAYYDPDLKKSEQDYTGFGADVPDMQTQRKEKKFVDAKLDNMGLHHLKMK
tara:strand:+ start:181676 stop:182713 length:1038 start_codon:yes stop_codon:yes gene_type:complete